MRALKNTKFKIFITVFLVYLFYIAPNYLNSLSNRYIDLTKDIVDDKTFVLDKYRNNTRDVSEFKGHYYAGAAPGLSFIAIPFYVALKPVLNIMPPHLYDALEFNILNIFFTFFLSILPGAIIAILLYDILCRFDLAEKERLLTVFVSSFGTILFYYSTRFTAHVMATFLLFLGFYILFKSKYGTANKFLYFIAGICLGMAVLVEYAVAIGALVFFAYAFFNFKKTKILHYISFVIGLSLMAGIFMYYHYRCFESPFKLATQYGVMIGPPGAACSPLKVMREFIFGTYRGIFLYMPILLFSIYGFILFIANPDKRFPQEILSIFIYSLFTFLSISIACSGFWSLGGAFGPRFFVCFIPFLMLPMAFVYKKINYKIIFWVATASIFINWCAVQYGDSDSVFTDIGLFMLSGLSSGLARFAYRIVTTYIRQLNVITHFSPILGFIVLLGIIYLIWKKEICRMGALYFVEKN